jgi:hypothetical protein
MDPFEGDTIKYGGREFKLSPPSFRHVRTIVPAAGRLMPKLGAIDAGDMSVLDDKLMDDALTIVFAGIQAGQPEVTREEFEALPCDMQELFAALPKVLHVAGLRPVESAPGEAQAGAR